MKINAVPVCLAATLAFVQVCASPATAQVSSDGTLSTTVTSADRQNFVIDGGDRAGGNLFHSFRDFSVPTGGSAYFNNATDIRNIFSRVTGGNVSNIDGLIRANGAANLFLLNPSGILLGRNARLNIGGSFVGTTANQIRFADGATFSATSLNPASLLTVSLPVGLQLGQNSGSIQVQGQGHMLHPSGFINSTKRNPQLAGLQVLPGETLALIGNTLRLEGGVLLAESGQIELGSISSGSIGLDTTLPTWDFRYGGGATRANIQLTNAAFLDASGAPGGTIHLYGQTTQLQNSSALLIQSQGSQNSGSIRVDTDRLEMNGALPNRDPSLILSEKVGSGQGANIDVTARQLLFRDGADVVAMTFQPGNNAGNITVNATESILLNGYSPLDPTRLTGILTRSNAQGGRGGTVSVTTPDLRLQESGAIGAQVFGGASGGALNITADQISLTGENPIIGASSSITSTTFFGGSAGDVTIDVGHLFLGQSGVISASTSGVGDAGSLTIRARDSIEIDGSGTVSAQHSRITASGQILPLRLRQALKLSDAPTGNGGNLSITSPTVRVTNQGFIAAENAGSGNAGSLQIQADTIRLNHQGQIRTSATTGQGGSLRLSVGNLRMQDNSLISAEVAGAGNGGSINLQVSEALRLQSNSRISASSTGQGNGGQVKVRAGQINLSHSQIATQATGAGDAGTIDLRAGNLSLNRGRIEVESVGSGNAGRLSIDTNSVQLNNRSLINASTQVGRGGNVQLQARDTLSLSDRSQIIGNAQQSGQGGAIRVAATDTVLQDRSRISTNAQGTAVGGALTIGGDRLSLSNGSQITASTAGSGSAGSLTIQANDAITLGGRNTRLAAASTTNAPAGSILLRSPQVSLSDRATISVSGQGQGGAGDLTIQANTIDLDQQAALEAQVAGGNRGNITLNANALLLRNHSTINTNATGTASGGNIRFNGNFLVGLDNSDIVARAQAGTGGNINITADTVVGIAPRDTLTPDSDINASSQLGLNGSVSLSNPEIQPDSGLVELPENLVDASQQVAQTCAATQASRFVATGRGGIPENPTQGLGSDRTWNDIRDLSGYLGTAIAPAIDSASLTVQSPILEATGFTVNSQGQVELVATSESSRPSNPTPATCSPPPVQ